MTHFPQSHDENHHVHAILLSLQRLRSTSHFANNDPANHHNDFFMDNISIIADCFGGISNMLELCLKSNDITSAISEQNLTKLNSIITQADQEENTFTHNNTLQKPTCQNMSKINDRDDMIKNKDSDDCMDNSRTSYNENCVVVSNLDDYYIHKTIIATDATNNLYFKYLSHDRASFIFYKILLTKWYPIVLCGIAFSSFIAAGIYNYIQIYDYHSDEQYIFGLIEVDILYGIAQVLLAFVSLTYILSANIKIVILVFETFDFWYKLLNYVIYVVCQGVLEVRGSSKPIDGVYIVSSFCVCLIFMAAFINDSFCISVKIKRIIWFILAIFLLYQVYVVGFDSENVIWRPFKNKNIIIDFLSLSTTTSLNLAMFLLKPVCRDFSEFIKHQCKFRLQKNVQNRDQDISNMINNKYQRYEISSSINMKPYFEWHNAKKKKENVLICDRPDGDVIGSRTPLADNNKTTPAVQLIFAPSYTDSSMYVKMNAT